MEEKRRVLVSLMAAASQWERRAAVQRPETPAENGRAAYAAKQAAIQEKLAYKFSSSWSAETLNVADAFEGLRNRLEGDKHEDGDRSEGEGHGQYDIDDIELSADESVSSDASDSDSSENDGADSD